MIKSKAVETEIHMCNQIKCKIFTKVQPVEKVMDMLLEDSTPSNVEKMVIQLKDRIGEYSNNSGIMISPG